MSETRSEHNHAASQAVNNRDNSRHGSVSSVNGNHRGAMSPSSVRSGENTPPHGPPVTVTASSQTRERAGSVANSIERRNSVSYVCNVISYSSLYRAVISALFVETTRNVTWSLRPRRF